MRQGRNGVVGEVQGVDELGVGAGVRVAWWGARSRGDRRSKVDPESRSLRHDMSEASERERDVHYSVGKPLRW